MRVSILKIISFCLISFTIVVFFIALNVDKRYSTENVVGKKIDSFKIKFLFSDEIFENKDLLNDGYYLINIWASWCLPCKKEHPILMKLNEEKNLNLIGVNFKDKKNNANSFLKNLGNPYNIILSDTDGTGSISFGVFGVPETILIDKEQIVIKKFIGPLDTNDYKNIIKTINENKFLIILLFFLNSELYANDISSLDTKIFKNLRCLVCQGQTIAESNSDFAQTIKVVVREKIRQGNNEKEIYDFLSEKYGEWIVYKPKFNYINSLLWFSPYIVLILGGYLIFKYFRKRNL